jgi:hypothetical protein
MFNIVNNNIIINNNKIKIMINFMRMGVLKHNSSKERVIIYRYLQII